MDSKTEFLLRRAKEESLKAMTSSQPLAADAHEGLAIRYSAKAIVALADGDEPLADPEGDDLDREGTSRAPDR